MDNIFDMLSKISDDELLIKHNILTGSSAIEDAYIIIVDDARTFDISAIVAEMATDFADEEGDWAEYDDLYEDFEKLPRIVISKDEVKEILDNIPKCHQIKISKNHPKTVAFRRKYDISEGDIKEILHQLKLGDYSHTLISTNKQHLGALLVVFITDKTFKLSDGRELDQMLLYIKIEPTDYGVVCVVSIHPTDRDELHPYRK